MSVYTNLHFCLNLPKLAVSVDSDGDRDSLHLNVAGTSGQHRLVLTGTPEEIFTLLDRMRAAVESVLQSAVEGAR